MSNNILNRFRIILKNKNIEFCNLYEIGALGCICGFHMIYAYGTMESKQINISKKYSFVRNGFTQFMIIDEKGNHYNMINSLWYWKWNSIEDWNNIKENNKITVKKYGYRASLLGIFPNIVATF